MVYRPVTHLGYFPAPYPNELWYSVEARFIKRTNIKINAIFVRLLYNHAGSLQPLTVPRNLKILVSRLPIGTNLTVQKIIMEYTLLPYIMGFISQQEGESFITETSGKSSKHNLLSQRIALPKFLNICLLCAEDQRKTFGEAFWDRRCQLPHVKKCVIHNTPLMITTIPAVKDGNNHILPVTAEYALTSCLNESFNISTNEFLWDLIARESVWLLENSNQWLDKSGIETRYHRLLEPLGYASYNILVNSQELIRDFISHYGEDLLQELELDTQQDKRSWLNVTVRHSAKGLFQSPIKHLLLINFLGQTVEEFFNSSPYLTPFGEGPWPCLNPICPDYYKKVITEVQIQYRTYNTLPKGIFSCMCGYSYYRYGPDEDGIEIYKGLVLDEGELWKKELERDWSNQFLSTLEICDKYRHPPQYIYQRAKAIGLKVRSQSYSSIFISQLSAVTNLTVIHSDNIHEICKEAWEKILERCKDTPEYTHHQGNSVYDWLHKNDPTWLSKHMPPIHNKLLKDTDDATLAHAIEEFADTVRNDRVILRRVTATFIIKSLGYDKRHLMRPNIQYPKVKEMFNMKAETPEEFALRKGRAKAIYYQTREIILTKTQFVDRAGIEGHKLKVIEQLIKEGYLFATEAE